MRLALLGDHPDALAFARALVGSGRHEIAIYTGPAQGAETLRKHGLRFPTIADMEEVLADPSIEAVIVAGSLAERPAQLRRVLQSERHALAVHPIDDTPDFAYEAAMIQGDTRCVLLPLLPDAMHPGVVSLVEVLRSGGLGTLQVIETERPPGAAAQESFALVGWDIWRALGGEIAEVSAVAAREEWQATEPLLLTGRFERDGLFRATFSPDPRDAACRLGVLGSAGQGELVFPHGWNGPARLCWKDVSGETREQAWDAWDPWPDMVLTFEEAVAPTSRAGRSLQPTWQTAVRCLELDDAARRSVRRRRVSVMEYQEASEEAGFKGTMTLVGCALLWIVLLLAILSHWVYWLGWLIIPVLLAFLAMQLLRWIVPPPPKQAADDSDRPADVS